METIYYLIQGTLPVAIPLLLVALGRENKELYLKKEVI